MLLTKSHFIDYLTSPLHLWLRLHQAAEPLPLSVHEQNSIQQGYRVEAVAQDLLHQLVEEEYPDGSSVSFQKTVVDRAYEARLDAVVHDPTTDLYDLYEIKSSSHVKEKHLYDVTFQYLTAQAEMTIGRVFVVHLNAQYQLADQLQLRQLFTVEEVTDQVAKLAPEVFQLRSKAKGVLNTDQPPAEHCLNPRKCSFPSYCFPDLPEYSVYDLTRAHQTQVERILSKGITQLADIPPELTKNFRQDFQLQSLRQHQPVIDQQAVADWLGQLVYPLYFLDYETYAAAIPLYPGYRPYQQMVTQFSLHVVERPDQPPEEYQHREFLVQKTGDPSQQVAHALVEAMGETGSVLVWSKNFECGRNKELAELVPELADKILNINQRTLDLMDVFAKGWYVDYRFRGSASIKKVLPVLVPELSYENMAIGEGATAMMKWHEMVHGELTKKQQDTIARNLLEYCQLDTWAMVKIWLKLREIVTTVGQETSA